MFDEDSKAAFYKKHVTTMEIDIVSITLPR